MGDNMDNAEKKLIVSSTPHTRSNESTKEIMLDVLIALAPAAVMAAYYFGLKAVGVIAASVAACVLFELIYELVLKKEVTIGDYSAAVTGVLLAFNLPASAPLWLPVAGAFFAIVVCKQLFGGLGQNFINPALASRAFLLAAYPVQMTDWSAAPRNLADAVSSATPLTRLAEGANVNDISVVKAFMGQIGGSIGETCAWALIVGGVYLIARRVISWRIPVTYIAAAALGFWVCGRTGLFSGAPLLELVTGGILLGAFFMATDYATSPVTPLGQLIMGAGCGVLTVLIRIYGAYPEGVSFSILLMNLAVPLIDRFTRPKVYGVKRGGLKRA
jgi:electron transport complex protein RnfD